MWNPVVVSVVYYILLIRIGSFTNSQKDSPNESFDAIRTVHEQLDDDNDGQIDRKESAHYMDKELHAPNEVRQSQFHNNDAQISVDELWKKWMESPVYVWTVDDVVRWLKKSVHLPQYEDTFRLNNVIGKNMPRLATSKSKYVQHELKIANSNDRKKIYIRAADIILFGDVDAQDNKKGDNKKEEKEKVDKNFLAIQAIHSHLDDNLDGEINKEESVEFVRDELKKSNTKRHASFHNNDELISVQDLWTNWQHSTVYNWTNGDVVNWLKDVVGLPQYEKNFRDRNVNGKSLPRLATDKSSFLQKELGILNSTHRKKIYLRASDIILFGTPEVNRNYFSDTIVVAIVLIASMLCFYAYHQQHASKKHIEQLTSNMEYLKQAEQMLKELQENAELSESNMDNNSFRERELQLREEIEEARREAERLHQAHDKHEEEKTKLQLVEQELYELRIALAKAENELRFNEFRSPAALQNLLLITYKKELQHFQQKKQLALAQMQDAKEACEKVNKTRRTVLGSLRLAHGQSIDAVDQKILDAKSSLADVTKNLQERQNRWQQIEYICNFNIITEDSNSSLQNKNSVAKGLTDDIVFGVKTPDISAFHTQLVCLSENEQLDHEVEAITLKGKLERTSTESSSSQESIQTNHKKSELQKQSPPRLLERTNVGYDEGDSGMSVRHRGSTSSALEVETIQSLTLLNSDSPRSKRNYEKVYTRSNTDPNNLSRIAVENRTCEKLRNPMKCKSGAPRPMSMGDSVPGSLTKLDDNVLPRKGIQKESPTVVFDINGDGDSLDKVDRVEEGDEDSLHVNSEDDAMYKSDELLSPDTSEETSSIHTSHSSQSLSSLKKPSKGKLKRLFHRKTKATTT